MDSTRALDFLKSIQAVPYDVQRIASPDYISTNLDPDKIPAGYLAALAYEWDKDGPSTPMEFIESLRPELAGSPQREVVRESLEQGDYRD